MIINKKLSKNKNIVKKRVKKIVSASLDSNSGLPGFNVKFDIGMGSCYLKYGMKDNKVHWIDVVIAGTGDEDDAAHSAQMVEMTNSKLDNNRSLVEVACREATELLQAERWTIKTLISAWRGTKFDPAGICPQVRGIVTSPFDAVAQYFQERMGS